MKTSSKRNARLLSQDFLLPSNNIEQHRPAAITVQQVAKRIQHFTEHECCTLLGEMLDSFDQGLSKNVNLSPFYAPLLCGSKKLSPFPLIVGSLENCLPGLENVRQRRQRRCQEILASKPSQEICYYFAGNF